MFLDEFDHIIKISIHALREEGDGPLIRGSPALGHFYPRPPRGGRLISPLSRSFSYRFLSTSSARRATREIFSRTTQRPDFYPRPPRGGRRTAAGAAGGEKIFLSTPSARRATCWFDKPTISRCYFYPRPPRGGRPPVPHPPPSVGAISIHALREEGDPCTPSAPISRGYFYPRPPRGGRRIPLDHVHQVQGFLSTPSARRATRTIHSPRSLCTFLSTPSARRATAFQPSLAGASFYFYPRPPRGGRHRQHGRRSSGAEISIHALREEGDVIVCLLEAVVIVFLSTPSARRATTVGASSSDKAAFLSTPSARRATPPPPPPCGSICNFYPRPPRGGRHFPLLLLLIAFSFLSTPSARRATISRRRR